jgi:osmotically-inducible protein OsmY
LPVGLSALPGPTPGITMGPMNSIPRTDLDIQLDVEEELEWTPDVDPASIGVSVRDGVVTLSGEVRTYVERTAAKRAARQVKGVTALVDELSVESVASLEHSDTQIAEAIVTALEQRSDLPKGAITVEVTGGYVTLGGQVGWHYQRDAARREVESVAGVRDVVNDITLSPRASASDAAERITRALVRNAQIDAEAIVVRVNGNEVTLSGRVRSLAEKSQATAAVWSSPHVSSVHNNITVSS